MDQAFDINDDGQEMTSVQLADEQLSDEQLLDEQLSDAQLPYEQLPDEQPSDAQLPYEQLPDELEPSDFADFAAQQGEPQNEIYRHKSHKICALLALFLGVFGIHKFYLGYNMVGFVTMAISIVGGLCTLGLATAIIGFISFIEAFIYLVTPQNAFEDIYIHGKREWF